MAFPSTLPIYLQARFIDPDGNPVTGPTIQIYALGAGSSVSQVVVAGARVGSTGTILLNVSASVLRTADQLPQLRLIMTETGHIVAEQWDRVTIEESRVLIDFGDVVVYPGPAFVLGGRIMSGVAQPIVAALGDPGEASSLAAQNASLSATISQLQAQISEQSSRITTLNAQNASLTAEVATLEQQNNSLSASLSSLQTTYATLQQDSAALRQALSTRSSLSAVVGSVGQQFLAAQNTLLAGGSAIQLANVSMDLKVIPSGDGTTFDFVTKDELASIDGQALSTVTFDINHAGAATSASGTSERRSLVGGETGDDGGTAISVPELGGLTELVARRTLKGLGLGARVMYQALASGDDVDLVGRVIKQVPAAGSARSPGDAVTLVLARPLSSAT